MGTTRQKNSCRNRLQNGPHSLLRMKVGTHSPLPTGSHTAAYTPKQGLFRMGALLLPSERFARFGNPAWPGVRTAYFATLGSWPGGALEERRKPSGQRCAYACRCPEGVAAPLGCVIFLFLTKLRFSHPVLRAFRVCETWEVSLPSARFACCQNAGRPLVKTAHLQFSCAPYLHL